MINFLCDFMNDKGLIDKKYLHKHNRKITALELTIHTPTEKKLLGRQVNEIPDIVK